MDVEAARAAGTSIIMDDGHRIWYRFTPGTGPAVLALHGACGNSYPMGRLVEPLVRGGRPVLLVDLRGHGFSDRPRASGYSLSEHADDVLAVIDHAGITRADIVGHCFGAMLAVHIAGRRPNLARRLVLISASMRPSDTPGRAAAWRFAARLQRMLARHAPRRYRARVQEQYDASEYPSLADIYPPRLRSDFRYTSLESGLGTLISMAFDDLEDSAAALPMPTLVVHGRRDAFVPWRSAARYATRMADARFALRDADNHVSHVLDPRTSLPAEIHEFLAVD